VVLFPEERGRPSKSGQFNASVSLDDPDFRFLDSFWRTLAGPRDSTPVWDFTPGDLNIEWGHVLKELGLQGVGIVPYQLRHSGVSIDLAKGTRTLLAAQKR